MNYFNSYLFNLDIYAIWQRYHTQLRPFCDNSSLSVKCSIYDALKAMHKANLRNWFSFYSFNHLEYEKLARYENGDINWIVPNKILAFSSPDDRPTSSILSYLKNRTRKSIEKSSAEPSRNWRKKHLKIERTIL